MKICVITYDTHHLKTEQLVVSYSANPLVSAVKVLALPFKKRPARDICFQHRPDQTFAVHTKDLGALKKVSVCTWNGQTTPEDDIDFFVIAGAGILDVGFAKGKPIVNAHAGIIPTTRGLDSFKWAILENEPVGVTLHLIDEQVDKGEIIVVSKTPVFKTDTIETFARRHYESEIELMKRVPAIIERREPISAIEKPARMRMPKTEESLMLKNFDYWKSLYVE